MVSYIRRFHPEKKLFRSCSKKHLPATNSPDRINLENQYNFEVKNG